MRAPILLAVAASVFLGLASSGSLLDGAAAARTAADAAVQPATGTLASVSTKSLADDLKKAGFDLPSTDIMSDDFTLQTLDGKSVSLSSYKGKVVILSFWATWCGYCDSDLRMLLQLAKSHSGLRVVALDYLENKETVEPYIKKQHLEGLNVWLDTTGDAYASYLMTGLPATFFIDSHGILRSYNYGALADSQTLWDQARHAMEGLDNTYLNQGQ